MADQALDGLRVAILAADGFEQVELTQPRKALRRAGALTEVISLRPGKVQGINLLWPGKKEKVDRLILDANPADYDALLIPGGFINPDFLRQSEHVLNFVREFDRSGKPIATLCHGPWVLVSAGLARGRRLACWAGIKDDLTNAGGGLRGQGGGQGRQLALQPRPARPGAVLRGDRRALQPGHDRPRTHPRVPRAARTWRSRWPWGRWPWPPSPASCAGGRPGRRTPADAAKRTEVRPWTHRRTKIQKRIPRPT